MQGHDGETAIHLAASGGHTDIVRNLIAAGASVNEVDDVIIKRINMLHVAKILIT